MFPANEMMYAAEIDYRRERLMAVRPKRRRRERHLRVPRQRRSPESDLDRREPAAPVRPAPPVTGGRTWHRAA